MHPHLGPGAVAQWLRSSPCTPGIPYGRRFWSRQPRFPSSSLPVARDSSRGWPKALGPCTRAGKPGRGSRLWIGIASAVALTWGVNHQTEDLPLCLSSLYIHLSNKKIIKINL